MEGGRWPTVKPVALVEDAILDCSLRGDIVLDAFMGSGTTIIAAERAGRRGFGMELDAKYVDVAVERYRDLTGEEPVHARTGLTFGDLKIWREIEGEPDNAQTFNNKSTKENANVE